MTEANPRDASPRAWCAEVGTAGVTLTLGGVWSLRDGAAPAADAGRAAAGLRVVDDGVVSWDSSLIVFLLPWIDAAAAANQPADLSAAPPGVAATLALARAVPAQQTPPAVAINMIRDVGLMILGAPKALRAQIVFWGEIQLALAAALVGRARWRGRDLLTVLADSGPGAVGVVALICMLTGMILAFIGAVQLRRFGAQALVADLVALAMTREMAAVMTGVVMAGRSGAAFAAQLSSMKANEEVDALAVMGARSSEFLVLPRLIGLTLATPLHYIYGAAVGLVGGALVSSLMLDVGVIQYADRTLASLRLTDAAIGVVKSAVFGALIAAAGCKAGLAAQRSAAGVGQAATRAVVSGIVNVIVADAIFAVTLEAIGL